MAVRIVRLDSSNAALLKNLADDVFDSPINPDFLAAFLNDPRHIMFVAVDQNVVVGMASGVEYFHPDKPPQLWINEVGVSPNHQRRGIGRQLTQALVTAARERGCTYAWLGTAEENAAARSCFKSVRNVGKPQAFLLFEWDLEDL